MKGALVTGGIVFALAAISVVIVAVVMAKKRGRPADEKTIKKTIDALLRRGFSWGEVKTALRTAGAALTDADDGL